MHIQHYENFHFLFSEGDYFNVSYKQFSQNFPKIVKYFEKLSTRKSSLKNEFLETFSLETWTNLNINEKHKHALQNCKGCLRTSKERELLAHLPVNLKNTKGKNDKNTSLLCPNIGRILQDRINKIMASARKAADTDFKKNLMLPSSRHRLTSKEIKKDNLTKRKGKQEVESKLILKNKKWKSNAVHR